jgi:hypothetical protein
MKRKPLTVKIRTQLSIRDARFHSYGALIGADCDHFVHRFQGEKLILAVSDVVEAMPSAEHF